MAVGAEVAAFAEGTNERAFALRVLPGLPPPVDGLLGGGGGCGPGPATGGGLPCCCGCCGGACICTDGGPPIGIGMLPGITCKT